MKDTNLSSTRQAVSRRQMARLAVGLAGIFGLGAVGISNVVAEHGDDDWDDDWVVGASGSGGSGGSGGTDDDWVAGSGGSGGSGDWVFGSGGSGGSGSSGSFGDDDWFDD